LSFNTLGPNLSAVLLNDPVADTEYQARSLPNFLGSEEGLKDPIQDIERDSRPVVFDRYLEVVDRTYFANPIRPLPFAS